MDLKLSQFPTKRFIIMGVKHSHGLTKRIKLGADTYESTKLSIVVDPYNDTETYSWYMSKTGGIVLKQVADGPLKLNITSDILIKGDSTEPSGNYLYSKIRVRENCIWVEREVYVTL